MRGGGDGDAGLKDVDAEFLADLDDVGEAVVDAIALNRPKIEVNAGIDRIDGCFLQVAENGAADHISGGQFAVGVIVEGKALALSIDQVAPLATNRF